MGRFDQVTVVAVNGGDDGRHAVNAIGRSMLELPGSRGLLIATGRPENLADNIEFILVDRFDIVQYGFYVIHCLHYHIHTDFALVVQDDGWVLNGENWNDEWFGYDYIGAPCHAAGLWGHLYLNYTWAGHPDAKPVMNGGFSFRSRAFLEAPTKYGICYKMTNPTILRNEDIQLCLLLRDRLEQRGLKFSPTEAALHFSVEYMNPVVHKNVELSKLFGHHGQTRRLRANSVVETHLTQFEIDSIYGENCIVALLEQYGYTVRRKALIHGATAKTSS